MMIELLAASDPGFFGNLGTQFYQWGVVALGIGFVIFVHELGHFAAAKMFGVKCEKFYVGFDVPMPKIGPFQLPSTLGKFRYGETEYGLGILPLGGYVKMLGQDDDPRRLREQLGEVKRDDAPETSDDIAAPIEHPPLDPRSYQAQAVWQRMIIISAGVVMNVITGLIYASIAFGLGVPYQPSVVSGVTVDGPAWRAGVEPGGRIVEIAGNRDDQMPFRDLKTSVLTAGLDDAKQKVPVQVRYGDETKDYSLNLVPNPVDKDHYMVGVAMPYEARLNRGGIVDKESVADQAIDDELESELAGAIVKSVAGIEIDASDPLAFAKINDAIYSRPDQTIALELQIEAGEDTAARQVTVTLPPARAKTLGISWKPGKISGLISGGPAEQAGMKVGDEIVALGGTPVSDLDSVVRKIFGKNATGGRETLVVQVHRGDGEEAELIDLEIPASDRLQSVPPLSMVTGSFGSNRYGFAFPVESEIASITNSDLRPGDRVKKITLVTPPEQLPKEFRENFAEAESFKQLVKGWSQSPRSTLVAIEQAIGSFPLGTEFELQVLRGPGNQVVTGTVRLRESGDRYGFERGLRFNELEQIRKARTVGEAVSLGYHEGKRKLLEVANFLRMAVTGDVKLRHVGGPLTIAKVAKMQSEEGIPKYLLFLTLLSMNLAILNFLPIPALDGGHMMFLSYEAIFGKRPNESAEYILTILGFVLLLTLMVVVLSQDIIRFFF